MAFWIVASLMAAWAAFLIARPLLVREGEAPPAAAHDLAVYKDQLAEIARDVERGLIAPAEAEAARAEVARKALAAADAVKAAESGEAGAPAGALVLVAAALPVALGFGVYLMNGSPEEPAHPFSERALERELAEMRRARNAPTAAPTEAAGAEVADTQPARDFASVIAELEARIEADPGDAEALFLIARAHMQTGRYEEAASAYERLAAIVEDARVLGDWAEARIYAAQGQVTGDARAILNRALALQPGDPRARYYLALGRAQEGDLEGALEGWNALLAEATAGDGWVEPVRARAIEMAEALGLDPEDAVPPPPAPAPVTQAPRPPTEEEVAAAEAMAPAERTEMIRAMVARLAERLRENPDDPQGWIRLLRSYSVMGDQAAAAAALQDARATFADDPATRAAIEDAAAAFGVVSPSARAAAPGPSAEEMEAAAAMSPEDRMAMIRSMVASLAERLSENPRDLEGWRRLMRSYAVLGERAEAEAALARALAAFDDDAAAQASLRVTAAELGLGGG